MRRSAPLLILFAAYLVLILLTALMLPLRIPEVLQLAANAHIESLNIFQWIAQTPGSAPLNYLVQLPFLLALGYDRIGARLDSLLFALAAGYIFLRLLRRVSLKRPWAALAIFMLLPLHFEVASDGRPYEQALFLLLLATEWFLILLERATINAAVVYTILLALTIYTDRLAFAPAVGYLLFLLRYVNGAQQRRALWLALGATVLPALFFVPFYLWAHPQANPYWPYPSVHISDFPLNSLFIAIGNEWWIGLIVALLLVIGTLAGGWETFRPAAAVFLKRTLLFCLFGGVCATVIAALVMDLALGDPFVSSQIIWAAPGALILTFAAFDWSEKRESSEKTGFPYVQVAAALLLLLSAVGDFFFLTRPHEDIRSVAMAVRPQLVADSCVVFVSERFSKVLFQIFTPDLKQHECNEFFHERIILASHPYVHPDQQADAESFFRGLNFVEAKRLSIGGGQIVVMQAAH